jgi:surface polysaccharide O-acyltransferase-like enzyme
VETRNGSIDAFRVIAIWAVICVHSEPFMAATFDPNVRIYGEWLNQCVRVATPFFFLAAGYFFAVSLSRGATAGPLAARRIQRLILFFSFWSIVYILAPVEAYLQAPDAGYWSAVRVMISHSSSLHFFLSGSKFHLWFLTALSCALVLLAAACRLRLERGLMGLAIVLFFLGLLGGAYKATLIGLDLGINTRNGPFFSTIFVVTGFLIHRLGLQVTWRQALSLIALGVALRILELLWITGRYHTSPSDIDYLLGTYPFGVGIFTLLLTAQRLGEINWLVGLSRYSAGAYCAHMLVVELLGVRASAPGDPLWEIARPFAAFALTFALVASLGKVPLLRPVVTSALRHEGRRREQTAFAPRMMG